MHDMQCRCFHHPFAVVLSLFGAWTALGFFIALFTKNMFLGFGSEDYFMSAIVLAVTAHGMKMCPCRRHHHGCNGEMCSRGMKEDHTM